jgi:DNA repair exonuclease SbcCD ATPase subunit
MKIVGLQAENFKRLRAVNIKPDGSVVELRGRNGQGKSSVLDAIWAALAGKSAAPALPIRRGAEEARIVLDLGELVVTRIFRNGKDDQVTTTLSVTAADGAKYNSPQTMLDKLLGAAAFDPLGFSRLKAKEQFDVLRQFVPGVDFDLIQRQHDGDMERRRDINRQAQQARAAATVITLPPDTPAEPVDESALVAELETAGQKNTDIERRKQNRAAAVEAIAGKVSEGNRLLARVEELRAEIERLVAQAATVQQEATDLQTRLDNAEPLPEPVDTSAIRDQITKARTTNANVAQAKAKAAHLAKAVDLEKQADDITAAMELRQANKVAAIAAAKMPVPGITFGDGEVLLNGVPFSQASSAEQLRASVAIAAAMNPKLRVIHVRDGSLLDAESLQLLSQFATENDLQVWAEIVDSSGATGIVIEDGAVKVAEAEAAA